MDPHDVSIESCTAADRRFDSCADALGGASSSVQGRLLHGALGLMGNFDAHTVCQRACKLLDEVCDAQAVLVTMKDQADFLIVAARYDHLPVDSLEGVVVPEGSVTETVLERGTTVVLTEKDLADRESKSWLRKGHVFLGIPVGDATAGIIGTLVAVFHDSAEVSGPLIEICEMVSIGLFRAYSNSLLQGKSFSRGQLYERERLVMLLHDDLAQTLFSSSLKVRQLQEAAAGAACKNDEIETGLNDLATLMKTMQGQLRDVLDQMRQDYGSARRTLEDVVAQRVAEHQTLGGAPVSWKVTPDTVASDYVTALVEAIVREGLANIRKHAHARNIHLWVRSGGGMLHVVLDNDGVMEGSAVRGPEREGFGVGLVSLKRLVEDAGGTIRFCAKKGVEGDASAVVGIEPYGRDDLGSGFTLTARLPLSADRNAAQRDDLEGLSRMQAERYGRRPPIFFGDRRW